MDVRVIQNVDIHDQYKKMIRIKSILSLQNRELEPISQARIHALPLSNLIG